MVVQQVLTPAPRSAWEAVVRQDPHATVYQTVPWRDAAVKVSGATDVSRLYILDDGRMLVLPMLRRKPLPGLLLDESYPAPFASGGLLASEGLRASDVRQVLEDVRDGPAVRTRIKANHDVADIWGRGLVPGVASSPRRVEVVDLDGGFNRVWERRLNSAARRAVLKAERSGLEVERDGTGRLVPAFYQLYLDWITDRAKASGLPSPLTVALARRREPLEVFEAVAAALGEECQVWLVTYQGETVAGQVMLFHGVHAAAWRSYSKKGSAGRPYGANNLLDRCALEEACERGCRYFSMGESGGVAGLQHYKQTMGATPRTGVDVQVERLPLTRLERSANRARSTAADLVTRSLQRVHRRRS